MKKLLSAFLVMLLALSLTACGSADKDDVRGSVTGGGNNAGTNVAEDSDEDFSIGSSSNNVYKNTYLGIGCDFDSSWHLLDDDELAEKNKEVIGMLDGDLAEELKKADTFYDMMAVADDQSKSINVTFEKTSALGAAFSDISAALETAGKEIGETFEKQGYTNIEYKISSINFAGRTRDCLNLKAVYNGMDVYLQEAAFVKGNYFVAVAASSLGDGSAKDLLQQFYSLD